MLNSKLVSLDVVISRVVRNLNMRDKEIPSQDMIEWASDCLLRIGSFPQFEKKVASIDVEDFKGELPCDHYKTIRLLNDCFYYDSYNEGLIGDETEIKINKFSNYDYTINFDQITTAYRNGKIQIEYLAIPIDDCGLPMVQDDIDMLDALFWGVTYSLRMSGWEFRLPELNNLDYLDNKWLKAKTNARASANMPDSASMHRLANQWLKLKPDLNQYSRLFKDLGR